MFSLKEEEVLRGLFLVVVLKPLKDLSQIKNFP
jgi:hypothetical protein